MDQGAVPTIINQIAQASWKDVKITTLGPGTSTQILNLCKQNAEGPPPHDALHHRREGREGQGLGDQFTKLAGFFPTVHPAVAYDTVYLMEAAIKACGDKVTRDNVRDKLQNLQGFVGLTGPIKFNPDGDIFRKYLIIAVENGSFVKKTDYDFAK